VAGCCSHSTCDAGAASPRFRQALWIALGVNAAMFVVEFVAGLAVGSVALWADALDFAGDAANYALSLMVLSWGKVGVLALLANAGVALLLYRFRGGDANMRSVWLCSRNDAIGNLAVILAAAGVFGTGSGLPDLVVALVMSSLALWSGLDIIRHARRDMAHARQGQPAG